MRKWFKKGCFWCSTHNGKIETISVETKAGIWVGQPNGNTLRIGYIFLGSIQQLKESIT